MHLDKTLNLICEISKESIAPYQFLNESPVIGCAKQSLFFNRQS